MFSFSLLADFTFLNGTFMDNFDYLTSNIMLPLGGLLITVFCGWIMSENSVTDELNIGTGRLYRTWRFLTRYVAPVAVVLVFLHAVGWLDWLVGLPHEPMAALRVVNRSALVPYSAAQMYALVEDVERYPEFLPWCTGR